MDPFEYVRTNDFPPPFGYIELSDGTTYGLFTCSDHGERSVDYKQVMSDKIIFHIDKGVESELREEVYLSSDFTVYIKVSFFIAENSFPRKEVSSVELIFHENYTITKNSTDSTEGVNVITLTLNEPSMFLVRQNFSE